MYNCILNFPLAGYTTYKTSSTGWLFSLKNDPNKFTIKISQHATYCRADYGPTFGGGHDLHISDQCNANNASGADLGDSYNLPAGYIYQQTNARHLLAGSFHFNVTDYEVFYKE